MFTEERHYNSDSRRILNVVNDLIEMVHGRVTFEDNKIGRIGYRAHMYDLYTEYLFTVTPAGDESCTVKLTLDSWSDSEKMESRLSFQSFALLDACMARRPEEQPIAEKEAKEVKEAKEEIEEEEEEGEVAL